VIKENEEKMNKAGIKKLIRKGEGISIEFKECRNKLNKDVFASICAFLNRNGGDLLLGVNDKGKITGIAPEAVEQVKKDLVTALNNPQKLDPPCYLIPEEVILEGKRIISLFVPERSQVHRCNSKIYDRNEDGDFDITSNTNLVTALYIRKQTTYSENLIYPYVSIKDLRLDLVSKARKLAVNQRLLRRENIDRYDDRDDIRTNLIESYDRLMAFVAKHLPDKFFSLSQKPGYCPFLQGNRTRG